MKSCSAKPAGGDTSLLVLFLLLLLEMGGYAQGTFLFRNPGAPTHIGSIDGPLAGTNIFGQALVGLTADSLVPVGRTTPHTQGSVFGIDITVPFAPIFSYVQVEMAVWDATLWGPNYTAVPVSQLGFTDIVPVWLVAPDQLPDWPHFTQSAIVPVPEPSTLALALLGAGAVATCRRSQSRVRGP